MKAVLSCIVILLFSSLGLADSVVSIQPPTTTVSVGDNFAVDVSISGVSDLAAFSFDINFNPAILSASSVTEGAFLSTAGPTFFIPGSIDNVGGSILFNADSLLSFGPGANGSGVLAVIDFAALAGGSSNVGLSNVFLADSSANFLTFSTTDGNVTVAAPEPGSIWLLLTLLVTAPLLVRILGFTVVRPQRS